MDSDQTPVIQMHLQELLQELDRKLTNPKNTWKRREDIQADIVDAQKRLAVVARGNRRFSSSQGKYRSRSEDRRSQRPI